jgi:hypothetical protein
MKTFDGTIPHPPDTQPAPPLLHVHEKEPGCCGPVTDRLSLVAKLSKMLSHGHAGLASVYQSIANDLTREENKIAFLDAARNQEQLAADSALVTTLDVPEEEQGPPPQTCVICGLPVDGSAVPVADGAKVSPGVYHLGCLSIAMSAG